MTMLGHSSQQFGSQGDPSDLFGQPQNSHKGVEFRADRSVHGLAKVPSLKKTRGTVQNFHERINVTASDAFGDIRLSHVQLELVDMFQRDVTDDKLAMLGTSEKNPKSRGCSQVCRGRTEDG